MYDKITLRVRYADTDQMGMVYYAHYYVWFEMGRNEYMRKAGVPYIKIEKDGLYLPVIESYCNYKKSARYDDVITVSTWISDLPRARVRFEYNVCKQEKVIAQGYTMHCFLNKRGKLVSPAQGLLQVLNNLKEGSSVNAG